MRPWHKSVLALFGPYVLCSFSPTPDVQFSPISGHKVQTVSGTKGMKVILQVPFASYLPSRATQTNINVWNEAHTLWSLRRGSVSKWISQILMRLCADILRVSFSRLRAIPLTNVYAYLLSFCANLINGGVVGQERKKETINCRGKDKRLASCSWVGKWIWRARRLGRSSASPLV